MIKALFFDIDGTLVSFRTHRIPQSTLDAVSEARRKGIKVYIATGRPRPYVDNLGTMEHDGIISVNGASCITSDGVVIANKCIPREDVKRMIDYANKHQLPVAVADDDYSFAAYVDDSFREVYELLDLAIPEIRPMEDALKMEVKQFVAFFPKEKDDEIKGEVLTHCNIFRWHPAFADCIIDDMSKATGIDAVCEYYGFTAADAMAFGDGGNDMEMLRHVGVGVAMGNARDEVKACADYVTDSVDEDGIVKALRHYGIID
jgi:hypothetical protein